MENLIFRKATVNDLYEIQNLNKMLFELEKENFDSTFAENWKMTEAGRKTC